jgi:hypothetical protein
VCVLNVFLMCVFLMIGEEVEGCPTNMEALLDPTYLLPAIAGALSSGAVHDVVMGMEVMRRRIHVI